MTCAIVEDLSKRNPSSPAREGLKSTEQTVQKPRLIWVSSGHSSHGGFFSYNDRKWYALPNACNIVCSLLMCSCGCFYVN